VLGARGCVKNLALVPRWPEYVFISEDNSKTSYYTIENYKIKLESQHTHACDKCQKKHYKLIKAFNSTFRVPSLSFLV
jgi:hypothetical protein